ncbi:RNA-binding domain-containing protein [Corynebacterium flavescens]|uniref:RNA-binding domain-containing protein n=1 Tax=Corynebacterium flavescens TaxID=28028 RepID=UPI003FD1A8CD
MSMQELTQQGCPELVATALVKIYEGHTADEVESAVPDFKEDPIHRGAKNPDSKVVELLVDESVCFANGEAGDAYLVLGVADRVSGSAAFTGTQRDALFLERKIFNNTKPNLRVETGPSPVWWTR